MSMPTRLVAGIALSALVFASATPTFAKRKKGKAASTAPGKYKDWKDEIDVLEIKKTFESSGYKKLVVGDFDTSDTPLPESDDNTYEPVQEVLADPVSSFIEGFREESGMTVETGEGGADALVVTGSVVQMDPGSRAARYWGGFGAGACRVELLLEIKDGGSGETLFEMRQERRSGVGVGGGNYVNLMNRSLRAIGKDLAFVLDAF